MNGQNALQTFIIHSAGDPDSPFTIKKMSEAKIELKNLESIQVRLHRLAQAGEELEATLQEVGNLLYNRTAEAFEKETAPDGTPWQPLADSTLKSKNDKGKMLWEDGHLQRSLSVKVDGETVILGLNATTETGFPYATVHQFGTDKAGRGNNITIPARPFLPITENYELLDDVKEEIVELLEDWVLGE